jgi:hypothetical protein
MVFAGRAVQVQVQVCFTSVCGQVQPLDVALSNSVRHKSCDSSARLSCDSSACATLPAGLLSVSISAAFVNVGFALVWLRLKQHTSYAMDIKYTKSPCLAAGGGTISLASRVSLVCAVWLCAAVHDTMRRSSMRQAPRCDVMSGMYCVVIGK